MCFKDKYDSYSAFQIIPKKMEESPFESYLHTFGCESIPELYSTLERIAKYRMRIDHVPFLLSELEDCEPGRAGDISSFLFECQRIVEGNDAEAQVKELIKYLKKNPPKVSYENPQLPDGPCTQEQKNLAQFIYCFGIDLPGSKLNLHGHLQYYSSFFIDMFFGNFTEFMVHINSLSKTELKKQLKKREGYCQFTPLFAPILGMVMVGLDHSHSFLTTADKQGIRLMYSGNNENKHHQIMKKLLKLGAEPNVHDINGFTPLLHAMYYDEEDMIATLLYKGANPNSESIYGFRPMTMIRGTLSDHYVRLLRLLLQYNGKLTKKEHILDLRWSVENFGARDLIIRVREVMPLDRDVCEYCGGPAEKKCSACSKVFYCSIRCQKTDWKCHKLVCNKD